MDLLLYINSEQHYETLKRIFQKLLTAGLMTQGDIDNAYRLIDANLEWLNVNYDAMAYWFSGETTEATSSLIQTTKDDGFPVMSTLEADEDTTLGAQSTALSCSLIVACFVLKWLV